MNTMRSDPPMVFLSTLLYRLLLISYPKGFQREYAPHMAQVFRDCSLRAFHTRGLPGMLSLWSLTLIDYIKSVFEEHTRKGVHMNNSRLIRLSGWALILGAVAMLVIPVLETQHSGNYPYDPYNYFSNPLDPYVEAVTTILGPIAILLVTIGVLGLYQRYSLASSSLGRNGLAASIIGGSLSFVVFLIGQLVESAVLWYLILSGIFLLFGGIFIFGIDAVRRQPLPRWNFLPILIGIWMPLWILASIIYEAITGNWLEIPPIDSISLVITSLGLVALGYLLTSDAPQEEQLVMG
jgi:hypothetical protein